MSRYDPSRALLHPLWWAALALLVVNDHVLKGAGVLPGVVTGKLSDVVGLVVAPWVLASLLRATTARLVLLSHVLVGVGFSAINLSPACARFVERVSAWTAMPWRITVDPTDLLALPALALSFVVLGAVTRRREGTRATHVVEAWRRTGKGVAFATGLLACVATSREEPFPPAAQWGSLFVVSAAPDQRVVTTRNLRAEVSLDCGWVAENPSGRLSQSLFAPAQSWQLSPGDALSLPLGGRGPCDAVLVGGGGAEPVMLFWLGDELPPEGAFDPATLEESPDRSLVLETTDGGGSRFGAHPFRHAAPPLMPAVPDEACAAPLPGRVAWSEQPPRGTFVLERVLTSPDGCHALDLASDGETKRLFLCLDGEALPFEPGEALEVEQERSSAGDRLMVRGDSLVLDLVRGTTLAGAASGLVIGALQVSAIEGCTPTFGECGSARVPAEVSVSITDGANPSRLERGGTVTLAPGVRLYLASAVVVPARDMTCDEQPLYLESFSLGERE